MGRTKTARRMAEQLRALGLRPGGIVLVHSSLSSLGKVAGGPATVIAGLRQALGPRGTLLLPALSYMHVGPQQRVYDVKKTPSNVGAIPEYFRRLPSTLRSVHPTHSVCGRGPLAKTVLGGHQRDSTPCGPNSPFRSLRNLGGQILFLGCSLKPNTSMHGVEELEKPPYLFGKLRRYRSLLPGGRVLRQCSREHDFKGWRQRYDRLAPLLKKAGALNSGRVLGAQAQLVEARPMWDLARLALKQDPLYFVDKVRGR